MLGKAWQGTGESALLTELLGVVFCGGSLLIRMSAHGCCLQRGWGLWPGSATRGCGDTGSLGAGGLGCFQGGNWCSCPSTCWEGLWESRCCSKARAELFRPRETPRPVSPSCWEPFPPHPPGAADAAGPFLALSSSGAGSRSCAHVLQTGARPLPGHSSASLAAHAQTLDKSHRGIFVGFFFF